ncbi:RNA-directed DNA polymerase, eukaryota [Tanacetum coccineum]
MFRTLNELNGIVNKKRSSLSVRGILVDSEWVSDPVRVEKEFRLHFAKRFEEPAVNQSKISFQFPTRLNSDQALDLERPISCDEIRQTVWGCGEDKSPGPDRFTGYNSSFVSLIPKNSDPKFVTDFHPISLIRCLYKVVTKILALRLSTIISGLISDVQTAFVPGRKILDGPFIINELLAWCKHYKHQAMVFKVDFAKAYDSVRWDYLMDVLKSFGYGDKWCGWIKGSLSASMASVLVNGSPMAEFQFFRGLKQSDPLAPYLFILVMESLHLSFSRTVDVGIFKGIQIGKDFMLSHLFYADDVGVILSNSRDRWFWDMNGSGTYRVKDVRNMLDDFFLPKDEVATRWLPHLPIKLNVFAWRLYLDRLPTKSNLIQRGIQSLGLFVVGGMWCGCLVALTPSGFLSCCRLKWVPGLKVYLKEFGMFPGGRFGCTEIWRFFRQKSLGKQ